MVITLYLQHPTLSLTGFRVQHLDPWLAKANTKPNAVLSDAF